MNVKKNLGHRIRGWFPQEPYMISTRQVKVTCENKQPPQIISPQYNVSATNVAGAFAIFWIILIGFLTFISLNSEKYPISAFQIVSWIIAGLTVGAIPIAMVTQNQLSRLSKKYQFSTNRKDMVLLIVPNVLFFIFGFYVSWSILGASMQVQIFQGFSISLFAWIVTFGMTRFILFAAFEKKENMRIMQSGSGKKGFVLIPKAPNNNVKLTVRNQLPI